MQREELERYLGEGLSLEDIGLRVGRHASTVSYWLDKHGLEPVHAGRHAARGGLAREELEPLVRADLSIAEIARRVDRSAGTVRHWLAFHGLRTTRSARGRRRRDPNGPRETEEVCPRHGPARHVRRGDGRLTCSRCSAEAVTRWRRETKRLMVDEAGGKCVICGYSRCLAALQFHHVDPASKRFHLSLKGIARARDVVRQEAQKCVLLCANCHAEVEVGAASLPDAPVGGNSIGRMLGC